MSPPRWRAVAGWQILFGGWLLVKAPYDERRRDFLADAPVSRWQQLSAYDTAEDCEWHRMNDTMVPTRPGVQFAPSEINEIRGKLLRCVPTESVYDHKAPELGTGATRQKTPARTSEEEAIRWVLLLAPITIPPGPSPDNPYAIPVPNPRAPIYQWTKAGEYDTEAACQRGRKGWDKLRSVGELPICMPIDAWRNRTPLPTIPKVMPR